MGGLSNVLLVSVLVTAMDQATPILRALGISTTGIFGAVQLAALGVGIAIAGIATASVIAAAGFQQSMAKIAALTGTSASQMQWYQQQLLNLAPQLDQAPKALADGLYFVISAGFTGAQAIDVLTLSAKAAAATFTPMASVSDLLTTAINAYGKANITAGHAMDDIIKVITYGKVQMSSLATSFGFVAVTARWAGLSFDETSAAVSTLSQIAGEHGARRVMMDLDNALRKLGPNMETISAAAEKMKGLKAPWDAAAFAAMNFQQKIEYIANETGGVGYLNKTQAAAYMATGNMQNLAQATAHGNANFMKLVGGAAAFLPIAMLLSDKGKEYNFILSQMGGNGQATAQAFDTMRQSLGQQWNMFEVTLQTIATVLGMQIIPYLSKLLVPLIAAGHGLIAFLQSTAGINALKAALLGIVVVITAILAPAIGAFLTGSGAVFVALFVAIVAAGALLGPMIEQMVKHFGGLNGILHSLQPLFMTIRSALVAAGAELKKAFADPAIQSALKQLQQALPALIPLLQVLGVIIAVVVVVAFQILMTVLRGVIGMLPGLIMVFTGLFNVLGGLGRFIKDVFTANWSDLLPALAQIGQGLLQIVWGVVSAILGLLGGMIDHIAQLFGSSGDQWKASIVSAVGGILGAIGSFVGGVLGWFGHLGDEGQARSRAFVSGVHSAIVSGLERVKAAFLAPIHFIANLFPWLYNHNYYVKALVDDIHHRLLLLHARIQVVIALVQALFRLAWARIQSEARAAWELVYTRVVAPVQRLWAFLQAVMTLVRAWLLIKWNQIHADIMAVWNRVIGFITSLHSRIQNAVQQHIVNPIQTEIQKLISSALSWGQNLIQQFIKGIQSMAGNVGKAAQNIGQNVAHFLGFHSPSPGMPESANWGPNLVKMFATGMLTQAPAASLAARQIALVVSNAMAGAGASAGSAGAFAGSSLAGQSLAGAGAGPSSVTTHLHFPGVNSAAEVMKIVQKMEQQTNRKVRAPGAYGGLRAGY